MDLRQKEPLKGHWFAPGERLLKNERWQDGLVRIAKTELRLTVKSDNFELMGASDVFYGNSVVSEDISMHYVNLLHVYLLNPELSLDAQHKSVRWFEVASIIKDTDHQIYMWEYARWIDEYTNEGVGL